jgi:hypothetical protein
MLTDWDFKKRIESMKFENPDFELLVLGNSFPEYGVDTELMTANGIKSYNLGIVGSSDETSFIQLKEYLTNYSTKPHHVLFCIASNTDPFYNKGIEPIVEFTMKNQVVNLKDIPISKFRWLGVEVLKKICSERHRKTKTTFGQIKSPKITPDNSDYKQLHLDIKKIESTVWIGEIAKLCKNKGIELTIIEMPGMRDTQNLTEIGPYTLKFKNGFDAVLYNFNYQGFCTIFDPATDWGGLSHLNQVGAAKFTKELIKIINSEDIDINSK